MGYIRFPIETDPETLIQDFHAYVQGFYPNWTPSDANLDVIIARFFAFKAGEIRDLASDVQDDIFRFYGATMVGLQPFNEVQAQGATTWTLRDSLGHTIPAGTSVSLQTTDGTNIPFQTVADVVVPPGSTTTAAGAVLIQALVPGSKATNLTGPVTLIDVKDWITSIALVGVTSGGVDAETDADYLSRLTRHLQRLSTRPILPNDFATAAFDASAEVDRAVAIDGYNPAHNLLTANQASAETDASGWVNIAAATTPSSTSAQAADGTKSVALTQSSATVMEAHTPQNAGALIPVTPGDVITGLVSIRSNATIRQFKARLYWYNAGGSVILVTDGVGANDSTTVWTNYTVTGTAPPLAAKAAIGVVSSTTVANGEVHYVDKAALRRGVSIVWSAGGTAETNNARMVTVAAVTSSGTPVSAGAKTTINTFLQSQREVGFVVSVIDPTYTSIDVTTTFKVLSGFDSVTTHDNVVAAIQNYLSPKNWGVDPTDPHIWIESRIVFYNEVIALISNVQGVDRVVTLTMNISTGGFTPAAADVTIAGPAGLTQAGAITATVV